MADVAHARWRRYAPTYRRVLGEMSRAGMLTGEAYEECVRWLDGASFADIGLFSDTTRWAARERIHKAMERADRFYEVMTTGGVIAARPIDRLEGLWLDRAAVRTLEDAGVLTIGDLMRGWSSGSLDNLASRYDTIGVRSQVFELVRMVLVGRRLMEKEP